MFSISMHFFHQQYLCKDFTSLFFSKVPVFDGARKTVVSCSVFWQIFPQCWHHGLCMHGPKEKIRKLVQKTRSVLILSWNSERKPCESPPIHLARCSTPFCWAENFTGPTLPRATYLYHELCRTLRKTPQADLQAPIFLENQPDQLNLNVYL